MAAEAVGVTARALFARIAVDSKWVAVAHGIARSAARVESDPLVPAHDPKPVSVDASEFEKCGARRRRRLDSRHLEATPD